MSAHPGTWPPGQEKLAREQSAKRNRAVNLNVAEDLDALASCITHMAEALRDDDPVLGTIAGQGIANHLSCLPKHVRDVFLEHASDEAARGFRADKLYFESAYGEEAA